MRKLTWETKKQFSCVHSKERTSCTVENADLSISPAGHTKPYGQNLVVAPQVHCMHKELSCEFGRHTVEHDGFPW